MPAIWTLCDGSRHVRRRAFEAWRVVESQHVVSTRKLVDNNAEQELLEHLLETAKPVLPAEAGLNTLHYLLFTPFRYPPLRHGSRFGTVHERGLWYASLSRATALAERAYYRLLFLAGTTARLEPLLTEETVFRARVDAQRFVDMTAAPFTDHQTSISSPSSYAESQPLGAAMRASGVQAVQFVSARDPRHGSNIALFEAVFASPKPIGPETWLCSAASRAVEFHSRILGLSLEFPRAVFEVGGELPQPGIGGMAERL
jgi:hypothetical protein